MGGVIKNRHDTPERRFTRTVRVAMGHFLKMTGLAVRLIEFQVISSPPDSEASYAVTIFTGAIVGDDSCRFQEGNSDDGCCVLASGKWRYRNGTLSETGSEARDQALQAACDQFMAHLIAAAEAYSRQTSEWFESITPHLRIETQQGKISAITYQYPEIRVGRTLEEVALR